MEGESTWKDSEAEHDIYGDLESSIFTSSKSVKNAADEVRIESLLKENEELKLELQKLKNENHVLLSNISSLHLTAKNEIEKKNHLINQLQKKLTESIKSRLHSNKMSKKDADEVLQKCQEAYFESHSKVTLEEIKKALRENKQGKSESYNHTKSFKFGNMSYYFINHQNPCHRNEQIEFPIGKCDNNGIDSDGLNSKTLPSQLVKPKEVTSHKDTISGTSNKNSSHISKNTTESLNTNLKDNTSGPSEIVNTKYVSKSSSSKPTQREQPQKHKNGLGADTYPNVRKSPRHLKNSKSTSSRSSSRDEPSRHSRKYSSDRTFSRSEDIYKKQYERKRSRERSSRGESRNDSPHPYSSERPSRTSSTRSSKRHRREIS